MSERKHLIESVGLAARGIAHALNNAIGTAIGNLHLALDSRLSAEVREIIDDALLALRKGEGIARSIGTVASDSPFRLARISPLALVKARMSDQGFDGSEGARGKLVIRRGTPDAILSDRVYFDIAFNALLAHAAQACPRDAVFDVECGVCSSLPSAAKSVSAAPGRSFLRLSVIYPGVEGSLERVRQAFTPWSPALHGSQAGIGLWFAREVARASGGDAWVEGVRRSGMTAVVMAIPAAPDEESGK